MSSRNKFTVALATALSLAALSGCATTDYGYVNNDNGYDRYAEPIGQYNLYGQVISIRNIQMPRQNHGGGALLGAIVGGVVGNQVGRGNGNTAATVAGAAAGAYVGNRIQDNNQAGGQWGQEIQVRMDDGRILTVAQPGQDVYQNARVKITGSGSNTRVVLAR